VYNWEYGLAESRGTKHTNLIVFVAASLTALILFLVFHPQIEQINRESPFLLNIMYLPVLAIGFLYGIRITECAVKPSEIRSPIKRSIVKIFLFFFVIGGLFSSVSFAMNGGSIMPISSILDHGLIVWLTDYVTTNGGATFLIVSSITLMATATRRLVHIGGNINKIFTFVGTFLFFSMLALSFTQSNPSNSEVYLYAFYQAGIIGGALFEMNKLTRHYNEWEDYQNGY